MKLAAKLSVGLAVLILSLAGAVFWVLNTRLEESRRSIEDLNARLASREQQLLAASAKSAQQAAEFSATEAADRAVVLLDSFVRGMEEALNDAALLRELASGPAGRREAVPRFFSASRQPLDRVVATDYKGRVSAVAPPVESLAGRVYLTPEELKLADARAEPRFEWKVLPDGFSRALTVTTRFRGGAQEAFRGVIMTETSLARLFKPAMDAAGERIVGLIALDLRGDVVFAPSPELVGRPFKECLDFEPVLNAAEGENVQVRYNLGTWIAWKRKAALGMTVIGLAPLAPPAGASGAGDERRGAGAPVALLGGAVAVALGLAIALVVLPLGRMKEVAQAAQAMAAGAGAVEFKGAGAKDEIGELMRALGKVGDLLSDERQRRESLEQAHSQGQRELERAKQESQEQKEFQKNLEERARREKEGLEGELQTARNDAAAARAEIGQLKGQIEGRDRTIVEREGTIAERERSLAAAESRVSQLGGEKSALETSLSQQATELAEARSELDRKAAAPIVGFTLLSEATDALTTEVSALLELVQGYVGQIIETEGGAISDEQQEFLSSVINRSARSQRMLGDLRDFANVSKPGGLAMEPIDVAALLQDVVATIQGVAEDKGLEFAAEIPASLPEGKGDEQRLRQLFTVILQNSVRFTPEGGRVSVSVVLKETTVGVKIEDGAEAIPMTSDEVFGHFHPPEEEILELRGSGLRYPILRAIAEFHGGAVDLAINEQGGNLFFIRLPVRTIAPSAEETADFFGAALAPPPEPGAGTAEGPGGPDLGPPALDAEPYLAAAPGLEAAAPPFGAGASPEAEPAGPEPGALDAFGGGLDAAGVETTDSILAASPETETTPDFWSVPGAGESPPTLDALEAAPGMEPPLLDAASPFGEGLSPVGEAGAPSSESPTPGAEAPIFDFGAAAAEAGEAPLPSAPPAEPTPFSLEPEQPPAEEKKDGGPPSPFAFGSDEIIQE